jgi:single-strand DNA-binding protein
MLRVSLLGNLGGDPEARYASTGSKVVSFNVAVNQVRKGQDGQREEQTEWFRIRVSGARADYAQRFLKGTRVLVEGRLSISHYRGKDGEMHAAFDIWADELEGMSLRPREPEASDFAAEAVEAALAGVSSLAGSDAELPTAASGRAKSANGARGKPAEGGAQQLEDLPF